MPLGTRETGLEDGGYSLEVIYRTSTLGSRRHGRQGQKSHKVTEKREKCCVSIEGLHPSKAAFEGQLRHNAVQRLSKFKGSSKYSLLFHVPFVVSHIPRLFARPKNKKKREKMAKLRGVGHHFCRSWQQKLWRKGKTSGDATKKCSKA